MYELRKYQQNAINKIKSAFMAGKKKIMVCSPTGSGKGVMLSHIINSAVQKGSSVLFLVHRREIVGQVSVYMDHHEIPHGIIMAGEYHDPRYLVNLASIQTIVRRMKDNSYQPADIIIIDEAHHATAATYIKVIEAYQKKIVIGFSATPVRQSGMGLGNMFDELITVATIDELVKDGFLVKTRYFAPFTPDLSSVKITAGDYNDKQLNMVMMEGQITAGIIEKWQELGEDRQTICFTATVAHSVAICLAFQAAGISAEHIDGRSELEERESVLKRFRDGDVRILCNCAVFTEGVDIPQISCVIFARPTKSLSLYLQCIGRGMRIFQGKTDCILLDHAGVYWEHGPVEDITDWSLDETEKTEGEGNKKRKQRNSKPIECMECHCAYTGQLKCPECGSLPDVKRYGKDVDYIDGVLGEIVYKGGIGKKEKKQEPTKDEKQLWYSQLIQHGIDKGYKDGWSANQYRAKFTTWPNKLNKTPKPITPEVANWLISQNIRRAKSSKKVDTATS